MNRRPGVGALALAATVLAGQSGAWADESADAAVKAAFICKLAPFVDWPAAAFAKPSDPFVICVVGKDPFGPALDRAIAGQKAAGRPIVAKRVPKAARDAGCEIMYLGGSPGQAVKDALTAVHGAPVLTVTEGEAAPGIIDFVLDKGQARYRVDDQTAAEDGLNISSKLLGLATSVRARTGVAPKP
jgi:hypothetical protein